MSERLTPQQTERLNVTQGLLPDFDAAVNIARDKTLQGIAASGWNDLEKDAPGLARFLKEAIKGGKMTPDSVTGFALAIGFINENAKNAPKN